MNKELFHTMTSDLVKSDMWNVKQVLFTIYMSFKYQIMACLWLQLSQQLVSGMIALELTLQGTFTANVIPSQAFIRTALKYEEEKVFEMLVWWTAFWSYPMCKNCMFVALFFNFFCISVWLLAPN